MGDSPNPVAQFGVEELTAHMISALKEIAAEENSNAIINYNVRLKNVLQNNGPRVALGLPPYPSPTPPDILIVDEALVAANESKGTGVSWSLVFIHIPYVPINPIPPPVPSHPIVFGEEVPNYPGFFSTVSGDGTQYPAGFREVQNGHTYVKHVYGPFGSAMWQMVA